MTKDEQRFWQYLLVHRDATPEMMSHALGVTPEFVSTMLAKIGTPEHLWRNGGDITFKSHRVRLLEEAAHLTAGDRNKDYGEPVANMQHIAAIFNAWNKDGITLTGRHIAMIQQATKMARRTASPKHRDSYVDGMAYTGIEYECALKET